MVLCRFSGYIYIYIHYILAVISGIQMASRFSRACGSPFKEPWDEDLMMPATGAKEDLAVPRPGAGGFPVDSVV